MEDRQSPSLGRLFLYKILAAGLAGGLNGWIFTTGATDWAGSLDTPAWAPPGLVIGIVWVILFQMMAIALWTVDRLGHAGRRWLAMLFILAQFTVSVSWVCAYFGARSVANGFIFTLAAWVLCLFTLWAVGRAHKGSTILIWPMLIWLSFAGALSFEIMSLNAATGATGL